jgi:hypothetical protein
VALNYYLIYCTCYCTYFLNLYWGHGKKFHGSWGWQYVCLSACSIPLQPSGFYQPTQNTCRLWGYRMVITTNICQNRMGRWLEENIGKYAGGGSITGVGSYSGESVYGTYFHCFSMVEYSVMYTVKFANNRVRELFNRINYSFLVIENWHPYVLYVFSEF